MANPELFHLLSSVALIDRRTTVTSGVAQNSASIPLTRTLNGAQVGAGSVTPIVGFYFGAGWCPPCRSFSPILSEFAKYNAQDFSVIFVSADHSAKDCEAFVKGKSFLSVPYESSVRQAITQKLGISMFPTLVICDTRTGKIITRWGRMAVMNERTQGDVVSSWLAGRNGLSIIKPIHMIMLAAITLMIFWYMGILS